MLSRLTRCPASTLRYSFNNSLPKSQFNLNCNQKRWSQTLHNQLEAQKPVYARKCVGGWLLGCAGLSFATVFAGGLTRLTKSGLSMVDWHLWKEFPPLSSEAWQEEFEKYQKFPEYKLSNIGMTIEEFKKIWWMEYIHRSLGRAVGLAFFLPGGYFFYRRWIVRSMNIRVLLLGGLILSQGLLGWWMVKSGLEEETAQKYSDPRVSHYRLAAHLGTAFLLYSGLLWTGISHLSTPQIIKSTKSLGALKGSTHLTKLLVFVTALSGAFVAGLDAGLIYNTYPLMGNSFIPEELLNVTWKDIFENPVTTQFDHRLLGHLTLASIILTCLLSRKIPLGPRQRLARNVLLFAGFAQVGLGISTLICAVPKSLAACHQAGALGLLSAVLWFSHDLQFVKYFPK